MTGYGENAVDDWSVSQVSEWHKECFSYRAVRPPATESFLAAVVGAGFAVDGPVVLVDEVDSGGVGEGGGHGGGGGICDTD